MSGNLRRRLSVNELLKQLCAAIRTIGDNELLPAAALFALFNGDVALSPDGAIVAVPCHIITDGSVKQAVTLWDFVTGKELRSVQALSSRCAFSPDGKNLATLENGVNNGGAYLRVWDVATGSRIVSLVPKARGLGSYCLCYSPYGELIASGHSDLVRVWNAETGAEVMALKGHTGHVLGVAFHPDGKRLASCGADRLIKLWDVATGEAILTLRGHTDAVNDVAFSPDGNILASASEDGTARLWDAPQDEEEAHETTQLSTTR